MLTRTSCERKHRFCTITFRDVQGTQVRDAASVQEAAGTWIRDRCHSCPHLRCSSCMHCAFFFFFSFCLFPVIFSFAFGHVVGCLAQFLLRVCAAASNHLQRRALSEPRLSAVCPTAVVSTPLRRMSLRLHRLHLTFPWGAGEGFQSRGGRQRGTCLQENVPEVTTPNCMALNSQAVAVVRWRSRWGDVAERHALSVDVSVV